MEKLRGCHLNLDFLKRKRATKKEKETFIFRGSIGVKHHIKEERSARVIKIAMRETRRVVDYLKRGRSREQGREDRFSVSGQRTSYREEVKELVPAVHRAHLRWEGGVTRTKTIKKGGMEEKRNCTPRRHCYRTWKKAG